MQIFIPYQTFSDCAKVQSDKSLASSVGEACLATRAMLGMTEGYKRHPVLESWEGLYKPIVLYAVVCDNVRVSRGKSPHASLVRMQPEIFSITDGIIEFMDGDLLDISLDTKNDMSMPIWFGEHIVFEYYRRLLRGRGHSTGWYSNKLSEIPMHKGIQSFWFPGTPWRPKCSERLEMAIRFFVEMGDLTLAELYRKSKGL